ncbi:MAG: ATP-binding protein [Nocardiopsaceae bacterium]|nr:ATP-binding protein [Nocardiopsaceae bacterium]
MSVIKLRGRIQVKVTDQGPRENQGTTPHLRPMDTEEGGGFGLRMVAGQAGRWGTVHEDGRTTVWFELSRPSTRT